MAARPRKTSRKGWPPHLYARERETGTFYYWQHPKTGKRYSLGGDFNKARIEAVEANVKLSGLIAAKRLIDRITDEGLMTVAEFLPDYLQIVKDRGAKANTIKTLQTSLRKIEAGIGEMVMSRVTIKDMHDKITGQITEAGKDRQAGQVRSTLIDIWKEAAKRGVVQSNPAESLGVKAAKVKRERWTLETFMTVYETAQAMPDKWIANCMKLALITGQPRECLVSWEFADVKDGFLWNERGKTGARIKLPLSLTLPGIGWNLGETIKECRDSVLSRFLLHHNTPRTFAKPGDQVALNGASRGIQRARDASGLSWPDGRLPPTLHEIRSLSLRLYRDEFGRDFAQALAGHKQGTTTDIYTDVRGAEWIEVRA